MAKIIDINDQVISIGLDGGGIKEVRASDINFVPHVGDEVEIFETETRIIVSKVEKKAAPEIPAGGININLANTQTTAAQPTVVAVPSGSKAVNKVTYVLLAFLLGGIGAHKFYAGKTGTGILFLILCWTGIPALIALFDAISGLMKPADNVGNIVV